MCVRQLEDGRAEVENQYVRAVRDGGNAEAQAMLEQVFRVVPRKWRGIGEIAESGWVLTPEYAAFDNPVLRGGHDGAVLELLQGRSVMTMDSYVVRPLFFPGGDVSVLAVNGTINDLAMCGAKPLFLTVSFILEEGLETETLWRVVWSMRAAVDAAGVSIVTGDTKVVERGRGDGIHINTTGVGRIEHMRFSSRRNVSQQATRYWSAAI